MNRKRLVGTLKKHEGIKLTPYNCSEGALTIGVGRNLSDRGITEEEASMMLINDIDNAEEEARALLPFFERLPDVRQEVILNMIFNLGIKRFMLFKKMLRALKDEDWIKASEEMLDSRWSKQVGNRAIELSRAMRTGRWAS